MNIKQEIIDAVAILVRTAIQKTCPVITFGIVTGLDGSKCKIQINNVENRVKYYGVVPSINAKYPVFIPFNNMALAFIITGGGGGGGGITPEEVDAKIFDATVDMATMTWVNEQNFAKQYYGTTAELSVYDSTIPEKGTIFVYSDHTTIDGQNYAGIRIADGSAYLVDTPFIGDEIVYQIVTHISNGDIHITNEERTFWNNKVSASVSLIGTDDYNLVLSTN